MLRNVNIEGERHENSTFWEINFEFTFGICGQLPASCPVQHRVSQTTAEDRSHPQMP
jgi:hypothetical protein